MLRKLILSSRFPSKLSLRPRNSLAYPLPIAFSSSLSQWREYHVTSVSYKRNDGASGWIEKPREFSKKQQKRFKIKLNEYKEKKNGPEMKEKTAAMKAHMESPEGIAFIKETEERSLLISSHLLASSCCHLTLSSSSLLV
jgi:hypothetical protein